MKAKLLVSTICVSGIVSAAIAQENGPHQTLGRGERVIEGPPQPKVEWSAVDLALREAMDSDSSYTTKSGVALTQDGAIAGWKKVLERNDLTKEQQAFAWWRLGSLYAYNFDPGRGESANSEEAERAYAKTRQFLSDAVTSESLNSATVYGTLSGAPTVKTRRLAESFKWLAERNDEDVGRGAQKINRIGYVLAAKFFPGEINRKSTVRERKQFLHKQLAEHRDIIARAITDAIQYSSDPGAIAELLKAIEDVADREQMAKWREMERGLKNKVRRGS